MSKLKDHLTFKLICSGELNNLPTINSNLVRIFLSSTFTDTHSERDYLIENIYPIWKSKIRRSGVCR